MPNVVFVRRLALTLSSALFAVILGAGALLAQRDAAPLAVNEAQVALNQRFGYQGELFENGNPVTAVCDFRFRLFDAADNGSQIGGQQVVAAVAVSNGGFAIALNDADQFGPTAFAGERRWLEIEVRCPAGSGSFTTLVPRQSLEPTPYALYALRAGYAAEASRAASALNATNAVQAERAVEAERATSALTATHAVSATSALYAESVPWRGITGVPANVANASSYSAGTGLQLGQGRFDIVFAGSGRAESAARSDHDHAGQDWTGPRGVTISNTTASGAVNALRGVIASAAGAAVEGVAESGTGDPVGVLGRSNAYVGRGVVGIASDPFGFTVGVLGQVTSPEGIGVWGQANALTGPTIGVWGVNKSATGTGVFGTASGVTGENTGVAGRSYSTAGSGVFGHAAASTGQTTGVYALAHSTSGRAILALASANSGSPTAVRAVSNAPSGTGVSASVLGTSGSGIAIVGYAQSHFGIGVAGVATGTGGSTKGIYGEAAPAHGWAGYFVGNVFVDGKLSASTKQFLIDHPLDPENKLLRHASVESSEQLNLYTGNVTLDSRGQATVTVPLWFSALNTDFRYGLTPIGAGAPGLYVASELAANQFVIAGGAAGQKVSWQVTGVRHDPTALLYPLVVEEDKIDSLRGRFVVPAAYGEPRNKGMYDRGDRFTDLDRGDDRTPPAERE